MKTYNPKDVVISVDGVEIAAFDDLDVPDVCTTCGYERLPYHFMDTEGNQVIVGVCVACIKKEEGK